MKFDLFDSWFLPFATLKSANLVGLLANHKYRMHANLPNIKMYALPIRRLRAAAACWPLLPLVCLCIHWLLYAINTRHSQVAKPKPSKPASYLAS